MRNFLGNPLTWWYALSVTVGVALFDVSALAVVSEPDWYELPHYEANWWVDSELV